MQAIVTKYFGPTDRRGSRMIASAKAGRKSYEYDDRLNLAHNHANAARQLAMHFGWCGEFHSGGLPDGTVCHVWTRGGASFEVTASPVERPRGMARLSHLAEDMGAALRENAEDQRKR